jgi:hypothetical protein
MSTTFPPFPLADFPTQGAMSHLRQWNPLPMLMNLNPSAVERPTWPTLPALPLFGNTPVPPPRVMPTMPSAVAPQRHIDPTPPPTELQPDYTDQDLAAALMPLVEISLHQTLLQPGSLIDMHWEPWLRTTIRRALAEQRSLHEPIEEPGWFDHMLCHMNANWSGRSIDEVLSEKIRPFRVEQIYLLARDGGEMLAHAAIQPRHTKTNQVAAMARHLAQNIHDAEGTLRLQFRLPRGRNAELRAGRHSYLIAVVVGDFPEILRTDLDFILRRIEERYGKRLADRDPSLAVHLRPYLQDGLLLANPSLDP